MDRSMARLANAAGRGDVGLPKPVRRQFLLAAGEDVGVDDNSGLVESFAGVTIVPAQSIGSGWEDVVEEGAAPAVCLRGPRSGILGAFLVSSALTNTPSICPQISFGVVGSGFGGVNDWRPLRDSNVMRERDGKLKATNMVCIRVREEICFGFVGTKRFCRAARCCIRAHQKKFDMKCEKGWFMASKSQQGTGSLAAFVMPFLDAAKVSEDILDTLKDQFVCKTTEEWEEFIWDAHEEWVELSLQRPLHGIREQSSMEDEDKESVESVEGKMTLTLPPDTFDWKAKKPMPPPGLRQTEVQADETDSKPTTEEVVEELQTAVEDLYVYLVDACDTAREESTAVMDHLSMSIQEVVDAINHINTCGNRLRDLMGDVRALRNDSGNPTFTLVGAVQNLVPPPHTQVIDMGDKVEEVKRLVDN
jgi:hypothetical protein